MIAWTTASAATAAVSARRMRGPETDRDDEGLREQQLALLVGKAALGADQQADRQALEPAAAVDGRGRRRRLRRQTIRRRRPWASRQPPSSSASAISGATVGHGQHFALLGGLDDVGAQLVGLEPVTWVKRVITGWMVPAPISVAFCTT